MIFLFPDEVLKELAILLDKSRTTVVADNYATLASFYLPAVSAHEVDPDMVAFGDDDKALLTKNKTFAIPNFAEEAEMLEWAGISFGQENTIRL